MLYMLRLILVALSLFSLPILQSQEMLKSSDISKIMQQILEQHVDQKEISSKILKNGFKVYIDQFDPDRIYLLDEEVTPYLNMSDSKLTLDVEQYKQGNFKAFEELNSTIQRSIHRARSLRAEMEKNPSKFFQEASSGNKENYEEWRDPDLKLHFAKNEAELKSRNIKQLKQFIDAERRRFGDGSISQNQKQTLAVFEKNLQDRENQYLYREENGHLMPAAMQENLFTMHVLKALASSLDAHTSFYTNSEAYDMKVRLEKEFKGVGVVLQQTPDGTILVNSLISGGPAAKSGLVQPNDIIVEIDGKSVASEPFEKVMDMMRDTKANETNLGLKRKVVENGTTVDKLVNVTLKREEIVIQDDRVDIKSEKFGDGIIGVITLHSFYQGANGITSENDVRDAIKKLQKEGNLRGLVLDLRENSGGFLNQAVKVAGLFITNGVVVISKYFNGEERFYRDMDGKTIYDGPLIVLTSRATASAAEIVAQALQDYGVALIVGDDRTYGKGTIQSQTVTENKATSYFKVTVGKYYTVSGKTPQLQGVKADIIVPGPFNFEHIGEQYLETTIKADTVPADYADNLQDIDPNMKAWYLRYYLPTLQHKKQFWAESLAPLKQNSGHRISQDSDYSAYLKKAADFRDLNNTAGSKGNAKSPVYLRDFQLVETINVLKDMISLEASSRSNVQTERSVKTLESVK